MFKRNLKFITTTGLSLLGLTTVVEYNSKPSYAKDLTSLEHKTRKCNRLIRRYKEEHAIPGIVVAVSQNNDTIYSKGFGYSDVENLIRAQPHTLMRIASISKPMTSTIAAILFEKGKLDFEEPITTYLKDSPSLKWNNKEVTVTARQLMSHSAGIRHYKEVSDSTDDKEFLSNKMFKSTKEALQIFINDELNFEPGKGYLYTTYGYTLLSAVLEKVNGNKPIGKMLEELFKTLNMNDTYLDLNCPVISHRSKYYERKKNGRLVNVPEVNSSYKYAGGGILSTTGDLLKFGNHVLEAYNLKEDQTPFLIKSSTIKDYLWTHQSEIPPSKKYDDSIEISKRKCSYGMGWVLLVNEMTKELECAYHTGGAVGASSCLLIVPNEKSSMVVAVICNSQNVSEIVKFTKSVSQIFLDD